MRLDIKEREEEIKDWTNSNKSKAFICKQIKCKPETLNKWLEKLGIVYKGNRGAKGIKVGHNRKTALEYLNSNGWVSSHKLKLKLIKDKIKKHECEICKLTTWNNVDISLELHHVDGNRYNNKIENLQILCPNCHSQTNNNSGKNKGKY